MGFPGGSDGKASACNAGDRGLIPGSGRSPGEGNGNPLQYSCLGKPMDRGTWWATVTGSQTVKVKSLSRVRLFATLWTVAHQAPLSMGFSRQKYWSGLPFPSPMDLPNPGIEPMSLALSGRFFYHCATWKAHGKITVSTTVQSFSLNK